MLDSEDTAKLDNLLEQARDLHKSADRNALISKLASAGLLVGLTILGGSFYVAGQREAAASYERGTQRQYDIMKAEEQAQQRALRGIMEREALRSGGKAKI